MKPPAKSEVPPFIWNFMQRFVPESMRGMATVELMRILDHVGNERVRLSATQAAMMMKRKMRYGKWSTYAAGFGVGMLFGTVFYAIVIHLQ